MSVARPRCRMRVSECDRVDAIEHAPGAGNGVDAGPRHAAVRGLAAHRHEHVDAALVGERHPAAGADDDDRERRDVAERLADGERGVVAAGLAGAAHGEHQAAAQGEAIGGRLHRRQRCGQRALLLGHAAAAHVPAARILDQLAGEWIDHAIGRMRHGIGHQHQAAIAVRGPQFDQQIAHAIASPGQAEPLRQRRDGLADEALHLRLLLEALGLWAGVPHERACPGDQIVGADGKMLVAHDVPAMAPSARPETDRAGLCRRMPGTSGIRKQARTKRWSDGKVVPGKRSRIPVLLVSRFPKFASCCGTRFCELRNRGH